MLITAPVMRTTHPVAARPDSRGISSPIAAASSMTPIVTVSPGPIPIIANPSTTIGSSEIFPNAENRYRAARRTWSTPSVQRADRGRVVVGTADVVVVLIVISWVGQPLSLISKQDL